MLLQSKLLQLENAATVKVAAVQECYSYLYPILPLLLFEGLKGMDSSREICGERRAANDEQQLASSNWRAMTGKQ